MSQTTPSSDRPAHRRLTFGEARVIARQQRLAAARLTEEVRLLLRKDAASDRRRFDSSSPSATESVAGGPG